MTKRWWFAVLGVVIALSAAACGSAVGSSNGGAGSSAATVDVRQVTGIGAVLANPAGMSLYSPAEEANGAILCTGSCTKIWRPLVAPAGGTLTAGPGLQGMLGVIKRPDGIEQVTLDGAPLYTFFEDSAPGQVTGNGQMDSFNGQSFTWKLEAQGAVPTGTPRSGGYGY